MQEDRQSSCPFAQNAGVRYPVIYISHASCDKLNM